MAIDEVPQPGDFFNAEGLVSTRDQGFAGATYDLARGSNSTLLPTVGTVYWFAWRPCQGGAITNVYLDVSVINITPTASQNYVGIYTLAGGVLTQQAVSTAVGAEWTSTGLAHTALSTTLVENSPYYFALLQNAGTGATFVSTGAAQTASTTELNGLTTCALGNCLAFTGATSQTALPASYTMSSGTALTAKKLWIAVA